jgi:hypothetical protein
VIIRGTDVDGDTYVLALTGPGDLRVINQDGANGPIPVGQPGLISRIEVGGTNQAQSKLRGEVHRGASGDGRVFFENLTELGGSVERQNGANGLLAIDMPDFWLGDTSPGVNPPVGQPNGTISIPSGVVSLRFGGVDTTAFFGTNPSQALNNNNRSDSFTVDLGAPFTLGTSVVVNRVVTANQTVNNPNGQPTVTRDTVDFRVIGRINLFQANSIEGDPTPPSGRYEGEDTGGTTVASIPSGGIPTIFNQSVIVTGAMGNVRVGGNATNFTVTVVGGGQSSTDARIANFFVGGETNKVNLNAPGGARNVEFGLGMDFVNISTDQIETLSANRGANSSTVTTQHEASRLTFGGDVSNTLVQAGYRETQTGLSAQPGGSMTVLVAGDVTDSVFAASTQSLDGVYGTVDDLEIPHGNINAKIEGVINNAANPDVDPSAAGRAFFARNVRLERGPIVPAVVPQAPYAPKGTPERAVGLRGVGGFPRGNQRLRFLLRGPRAAGIVGARLAEGSTAVDPNSGESLTAATARAFRPGRSG